MNIVKTKLDDVLIIEPDVFGDHRGWFTETYSKKKFGEVGINVDFIQDNHSMSSQKGTLRGLHFQTNPKAQTKLVRCTRGKILDVAVDLRKGSATFGKWVSVELSEENKRQLLIPKGFAHGFLSLTEDVEVQYKVDEYYSPECDRSIKYNDPDIGVVWGIDNPILSQKDLTAPFLRDCDPGFSFKFLVTGVNGQLGYDVVKRLRDLSFEVIAPIRSEFDITNREQVLDFVNREKPDFIIHCAAYTLVDKAEDEKELCYSVNVNGTKNVVDAAKIINARMVFISSDYVFDGYGDQPYLEDDDTSPVNYYGYTKELGEQIVRNSLLKHFIVRTSWVYGANGNNFVKTMLRLAESKSEIKVVYDQIGAPTYSVDLAKFIVDLIQTEYYGTYHGVNEGFCSWYDFAKEIFDKSGKKIEVTAISSEEFPTKAKRPKNSRLSKVKTDLAKVNRLPSWEDALERFLSQLLEE